MENVNILGERIKAKRKEFGLSYTALAQLAGISKAHLHQIEKGDCPRPSAAVLYEIATALETTIEYLLGHDEVGVIDPDGPHCGKCIHLGVCISEIVIDVEANYLARMPWFTNRKGRLLAGFHMVLGRTCSRFKVPEEGGGDGE